MQCPVGIGAPVDGTDAAQGGPTPVAAQAQGSGRPGRVGAAVEARPGLPVSYLHDGSRVILLLCGGDKSTQQRDIERAYQPAEEYWSEKGHDHG